jgi:uncharacterized C2H2 Zn-finger protein
MAFLSKLWVDGKPYLKCPQCEELVFQRFDETQHIKSLRGIDFRERMNAVDLMMNVLKDHERRQDKITHRFEELLQRLEALEKKLDDKVTHT